jgi:hypothetical protein
MPEETCPQGLPFPDVAACQLGEAHGAQPWRSSRSTENPEADSGR